MTGRHLLTRVQSSTTKVNSPKYRARYDHRRPKLIACILYGTSGASDLLDFVWEFNRYLKMVEYVQKC